MTYLLDAAIKNPQFLITEHTSAQVTSSSANTAVIITGSEFTYSPHPQANKVVYEIGFYGERKNYIVFQCLTLQEYVNNVWTEINSRFLKNIGNSGSVDQNARYFIHYRYVLPTWTGNKQLRLITASSSAGRQIALHGLSNWNGAATTSKFCNTNLLMYSI